MRAFIAACSFALIAFTGPAHADPKPDGFYVKSADIDLVALLPPAPPAGSPTDKADIAAVQAYEKARTPETSERAKADNEMTVFRLAGVVLGADFTPEKLPITTAFFARVKLDSGQPTEAAKAYYNRPRPSVAEPSIQPLLPLPKNAAYPSGHTTWSRLNAIVLAGMVPEKRVEIFARADEYADDRIVAGVHYPTDIAAGKVAGSLIAQKELENPDFDKDFQAAKAELRSVLKLNATQ
ncbi:MAG TPA: phosphatase PAP2 family protein [Hansschlegelia sp.]